MRILVAAPPFAGHLHPLLVLGLGLRRFGIEPVVVTGVSKAPLVTELGLPVVPLFPDDPGVFDRISDTPGPVRSRPLSLVKQLAANLDLFPGAAQQIDAAITRHRPDAVLADFTAPVAGMVGERHGLPWVTTMPTPFALETRTGTPSYCGGWGPARHAGHRMRDAAGRSVTRWTKRGMSRVLRSRFAAAGAQVYRPDGSEAAYSPTAILGLGMTELEFDRDWPAPFRMIGPVTGTVEPTPDPPGLAEGPLVLVTLGTHLRWAKDELPERAAALVGAIPGATVVVSLGEAARRGRPPIVDRTGLQVYGHLPYDRVLRRCVAVVHHGGAGITYAAIQAGVPAVVLPQDYDQFDFAARIDAAGAGVRVRRWSRVPAALARVASGDRSRLDALRSASAGYDPVTATAQTLFRVTGRTPRPPGPPARA